MLEVRHSSVGLMIYFTFHTTIPISPANNQVQRNSIFWSCLANSKRFLPNLTRKYWSNYWRHWATGYRKACSAKAFPEWDRAIGMLPACLWGGGIHSEQQSLKPSTTCDLQVKALPWASLPSARNTHSSYTCPLPGEGQGSDQLGK